MVLLQIDVMSLFILKKTFTTRRMEQSAVGYLEIASATDLEILSN